MDLGSLSDLSWRLGHSRLLRRTGNGRRSLAVERADRDGRYARGRAAGERAERRRHAPQRCARVCRLLGKCLKPQRFFLVALRSSFGPCPRLKEATPEHVGVRMARLSLEPASPAVAKEGARWCDSQEEQDGQEGQ